MKQFLLLLVALLSCAVAFAQDTLPKAAAPAFKRLQLGVNFSPDYCYRTLRSDGSSANLETFIALMDEREQPTFGYTTGLSVYYQFTRNIGLEVGAQYSNKGYAEKPLEYSGFITPDGFIYDPAIPQSLRTRHNFTYLDIPFRLVGRVGKGKLQLVAGLGVAVNVLLKSTTTRYMEYTDGHTERTKSNSGYNYAAVNLSPMASIGVGYRLNHHFALQLEPTFRYGMLKLSDTPIQTYLWNAGANFTCYYAL